MKRDTKWVLLIAGGVVLGLLAWTVVNAVVHEIQQGMEKARKQREVDEMWKKYYSSLPQHDAWIGILADARFDKVGTLKQRIERHVGYKVRVERFGNRIVLLEEKQELEWELNHFPGDWKKEVSARLEEVEVELASTK